MSPYTMPRAPSALRRGIPAVMDFIGEIDRTADSRNRFLGILIQFSPTMRHLKPPES